MIRIIACGKVKEAWMRDGIQEYLKRLRPYEKVEIIETADEKTPDDGSEAEYRQILKKEGERLLKQIRDDDYVILLDLKGKELRSEALAEKLQDIYSYEGSRIDFVIGGSLGVSEDLIRRADFRWKLSDCTFPHQLCRVIVLEQIYRSFRILRNEPYHK
jgi:23S rRNA (pseudouridine1915-N3)-methyltransferase